MRIRRLAKGRAEALEALRLRLFPFLVQLPRRSGLSTT
jgi:hypothetical protein